MFWSESEKGVSKGNIAVRVLFTCHQMRMGSQMKSS